MAFTLRLADKKRFERKRDDGVPNGIRTRVHSVRGCCPRPLDDRDVQEERSLFYAYFSKRNAPHLRLGKRARF